MLTLRRRGCSALWPPLRQRANPQRGKTTNRRAGCGRTACPVRREGGLKPISSSYPYQAPQEIDMLTTLKTKLCALLRKSALERAGVGARRHWVIRDDVLRGKPEDEGTRHSD